MKINFLTTIIAIAISSLIAYGFYTFSSSENKIILSLGSFLFLSIALINMIGINFKQPRTTTNIRVVSGVFFGVFFFLNLLFSGFNFSIPTYVIINGIIFLLFMLIIYGINRAKQ